MVQDSVLRLKPNVFPCLFLEVANRRNGIRATFWLWKKDEGKGGQNSSSNSSYTNMPSGFSPRETFGLLQQTVHLRLAECSMTENV